MVQAKSGDTVKVHYTGRLDDGTKFHTSIGREPLQFTIGKNQLIPAFEQAIVGMKPGESKTIKIPAQNAFGPYYDDLVRTIKRDQFPPDLEPEVGQKLNASHIDGQTITVTVIDVTESSITLDANHPLAGQNLTFEIKLIDIL